MKSIQPVKKIIPEFFFFHGFVNILVGCSNNTDFNRCDTASANPKDLFLESLNSSQISIGMVLPLSLVFSRFDLTRSGVVLHVQE